MVPTAKVVEDGLEAVPRRADRSRWGWLAAGLLIGAGGAVMVIGVDEGVTQPAPTVPGTLLEDIGGTGNVIDGFPDGLIGTTRSNGRSLTLVTWPLGASPHETSVTFGASDVASPVSFDVSGGMLATALPMEGSPPGTEGGGVLYAGVPDRASIIDLDVTGYAWHDTSPTSLAYTTSEDQEMVLWVTTGDFAQSTLVARTVGIDGGLVAWGDWGFAVQDDDSIVLINPSGEITNTHPGRFIASDAGGRLAIDDGDTGLLGTDGVVRSLDREGLRGEMLTGDFSPDGEALALLTPEDVLIVDVDEETGLTESGTDPALPYQVVWTSDSRFVLYPGNGGIVVTDTTDFGVDVVLTERTFTGVGVIPSASD